MMSITFMNNYLLILLAIIPLIVFLYFLAHKKMRKKALKFSKLSLVAKASKKTRVEHIPFYLLLGAIALIILGLADPHIPLKTQKEGINVIMALDVSGSMQATDYTPNRLEAAKKSAELLVDGLKPKDYAGVVIFQSGATTAAYLSPLKNRVKEKLRSIKPSDGKTAIGDGLSLAVDMALSIPNKKKIIILLSDGDNNAGFITPEEAVKYAQENHIQVYTIGMGSEKPVVLDYDWFGNPVYAKLNEELLRDMASKTNGQYFKSVDSHTLQQIYSTISQEIQREWEDVSIKDYFFAAALVMLLITLFFQYGKYGVVG